MRRISKLAEGLLQLSVERGGVSDVYPDWLSSVFNVSHGVCCFAISSRENVYVFHLATQQSEIWGFVTVIIDGDNQGQRDKTFTIIRVKDQLS